MPWTVRTQGGKHCVVKLADGSVVACHATAAEAQAQVRALYASEPNAAIQAVAISLGFGREGDVNVPGAGHQLRDYWTRGAGAAKIRWNTEGDGTRCIKHLSKYVRDPGGLCQEYHRRATGKSMHPHPGRLTEAVEMDEFTAATKPKCPPGQSLNDAGECVGPSDKPDVPQAYADQTSADEPWQGVLTIEGAESGDGRVFSLGSLDWAQLPMPLMYQPANSGGHKDSIMVGEITHAARKANAINGWGNVFGHALAGEHGDDIRSMMKTGGVSVDVDQVKDADVEMIYADDESSGGFAAKPETTIFHRGRIRGATLVAFPAFVEAKLHFTNDLGDDADDGVVAAAACGCGGCACHKPLVAAAHTITIPDLPKAEWFNEPTDVKIGGALTITDEGRIYGLVAPAGVTHRNKPTQVPRSLDFSRFHKGETIVEGGTRVITGVITADCGHAPTENYGTLQARMDHYDNSCSVLANVRVGYRPDGAIWMAGALNAGAKPSQVAQAMGCTLSLDAQPHPDRPGVREFIAAHLVPVPGFPMARQLASVTYEDGVVTASSVPVRHRPTQAFADVVEAKRATMTRFGMDPAARKQRAYAKMRKVKAACALAGISVPM